MRLKSAPTKIQQITDYLTERIRRGKLKPGDRLGTIRHFAREFDVSNKTVECAFARLEADRLLIREAGRGCLVASPDPNFQRTIGLVAVLTTTDPHAEMPLVFQRHASARSYLCGAFDFNAVCESSDTFRLFLESQPHAVMIKATSQFPFELIDAVPPTTRLLFVDSFEREKRFRDASYILADYADGGRMAAEALLAIGKRRIAILTYETRSPVQTSSQFYEGARQVLSQAGLEPHSHINTDLIDNDRLLKFLSRNPPDGVLAYGDFRALPLIRRARELGLRIPDDLAIIGYNNTPHAEAWDLTSVSINYEEIMRWAFESLDVDEPIEINVSPRLVHRGSCPSTIKPGASHA